MIPLLKEESSKIVLTPSVWLLCLFSNMCQNNFLKAWVQILLKSVVFQVFLFSAVKITNPVYLFSRLNICQ